MGDLQHRGECAAQHLGELLSSDPAPLRETLGEGGEPADVDQDQRSLDAAMALPPRRPTPTRRRARTRATPSTDPPSPSNRCRPRSLTPRLSCRNAILDAIDQLHPRTGATEFTRRDIVAEVQAGGTEFERQTIYRCIRRLGGHESGSAYGDLDDLGNNWLRLRPWPGDAIAS